MRSNKTRMMFLIIFIANTSLAQEDWEPQTFVTGYLNTIAEVTNQPDFEDINKNIGIGLAEVGFLVSHKPLPNVELKSTLVWKHDVPDLQSMVVEAYGIYTVSEEFKIGVGKFLTPLSPVNTYFYAPLTPSVALPMVISHYVLAPQSMGGVQLSGSMKNEFEIEYNVTYGLYSTIGHIRGGIINLLGAEDLAQLDPGGENTSQIYDLGGSARLAMKYDFLSIGANYFDGTRATLPFVDISFIGGDNTFFTSRKWSYGVDFHLNFNDQFKLNAEYWKGGNKATDVEANRSASTGNFIDSSVEYNGHYVELLYTVGKFTPYIRFEDLKDASGTLYAGNPTSDDPTGGAGLAVPFQPETIPWGTDLGTGFTSISSFGFGVAYRPSYEILLKTDLRFLATNQDEFAANVFQLDDQEFYHLMMSAVFSF